MAAVRSLRVSVKSDSGSDRSDSDSESDRDAREAEPMEVEEGELEPEDISVNRSLKELLPDTSRRYENKAGAFITGIDVNSKEAIERKEKRAQRFHFHGEEKVGQRNVFLDKDAMKKTIPQLRMEAIHVMGVDDMSTQDVFGYFKEYPPAHIEWIDDTSCNVVWLDDDTPIRALINTSRMPDSETVTTETGGSSQPDEQSKGRRGSGAGREALLASRYPAYTTRRATKAKRRTASARLNTCFLCADDKKEPGAARRSRYYMKYGNPNYGGMKGILSNSWKRRYHNRRIQRDVIKSKKPLIGDSMGHTPPYTHRHSGEITHDECIFFALIVKPAGMFRRRAHTFASNSACVAPFRNRIGTSGSQSRTKSSSPSKVTDVRQLLEEKRQGHSQHRQPPPAVSGGKTDVRQRLGKRRYSPDRRRSPSPLSPRDTPLARDVHRRLGVASQDSRGHCSNSSTDRKTGGLWSRLGSSDDDGSGAAARRHDRSSGRSAGLFSSSSSGRDGGGSSRSERRRGDGEGDKEEEEDGRGDEEDDSTLQRMWGAMIKQKQERLTHKMKKSRLDNLPSLQIEISRDSSDESDA
ncbi:nuclear cap-binding protein subunit 3 [Neolamprologus brichardi]|uniref:nuclear cap-binding protein subunit 3 n=1 Tax=Neolamprologus brichardi TaxID=32507 RepID=UPI001643E77F|nr:nuclear cap-binding protein subunit 3 [Neolamprologus brichardi]